MDRRTDDVPLFGEALDFAEQGYSSNMKMMVIAAIFLMVAIGVMLIQPNSLSQDIAAVEQPSDLVEPAVAVTRSQTSLLTIDGQTRSRNVSELLRQHAVTGESRDDMDRVAWDVLLKFGHTAGIGDPLHIMLSQALFEGQSDAYIDALLNISVARGEIKAPVALQMTSGRLNTEALLQELVAGLNQ